MNESGLDPEEGTDDGYETDASVSRAGKLDWVHWGCVRHFAFPSQRHM